MNDQKKIERKIGKSCADPLVLQLERWSISFAYGYTVQQIRHIFKHTERKGTKGQEIKFLPQT